jgi:hypothetical protein
MPPVELKYSNMAQRSGPVPMKTRALVFGAPNDTPNQLRAATRARSDAARQLPRLTIALAEAICNCRDAVAQMPPRRGSAGPANGRASAALGS